MKSPATWAKARKFLEDLPPGFEISEIEMEQFLHFRSGPIWDGNLISKSARDKLVDIGLVERCKGFQFLTHRGVELLVDLNCLNEETWREFQKG